MAQLAAGDREALGTLVARHQQRVLSLARRFLGNDALAEDVAQDAFLRIWRSAATYTPTAQFATWLYRIVANLCWDLRRRARLRVQEDIAGRDPPVADAPAAERAETVARVQAAVAELPDRQRLALLLHRYEGLSQREIADITGWSVSAVESCLVRAYEKLRQTLRDLRPGPH